MKIRNYNSKDIETLTKLIFKFKNEESAYDKEPNITGLKDFGAAENYLDKLIKDVEEKEGYFFVAEIEGEIVGFVMGIIERYKDLSVLVTLEMSEQDIGWVGVLYVIDNYRGKGLGRELLAKAEQYCKDNGCNILKLNVLSENPAVSNYVNGGYDVNCHEMFKKL